MGNSKIYSKIIYSRLFEQELKKWIVKYPAGKVFLATEETVDEIWVSNKAGPLAIFRRENAAGNILRQTTCVLVLGKQVV